MHKTYLAKSTFKTASYLLTKSKNLGSRALLKKKNILNKTPQQSAIATSTHHHSPSLNVLPSSPSPSHHHPTPHYNLPSPLSLTHLLLALCSVVHMVAKAWVTAQRRSAYTATRSGSTSSPAGRGLGGVWGEVGFSGTVGGTAGRDSGPSSRG